MSKVSFTADQMMTLLEYLESQHDAGYDLEDVIEGIKDGSLTTASPYTNPSLTQ